MCFDVGMQRMLWAAAVAWAMVPVFLLGQATGAASDSAPDKDVLVFANGDRLSGKLLRGVKGSLTFHSDVLGDVTVPLDKVKEMQTSGTFAVLQKHVPVSVSQKMVPEKIALSSEGVVLQPATGSPSAPIPLNQVVYIVDGATFEKSLAHKTGALEGWNGTVTAGTTFVQSTQHGGTFNGSVALVRQVPVLTYLRARNKTLVNVQETYGTLTTPLIPQTTPATPDATVKTNIFHGDLERDEYVSKRAYLLGSAMFDHNLSQGLQLQQAYGFGFGYSVLSTPVQTLDVKADVHYEKQEFFLSSQNLNLVGSVFAETYSAQLPRKLVLTEGASITPAWNDMNAYAAAGNIGLTMPVLKRLSVSLGATDNFINNPSPGYQKNSLQFVTGLAYSLH